MGSGKSTVGSVVAERLGRRFIDNDDLLLDDEGAAARSIAQAAGLPTLHDCERRTHSRHLAELVDDPHLVQALPASVAVWPDRDELLAPYIVVWLTAPPEVLSGRVHDDDHRPLAAGTALEQLRRQEASRAEVYAELADLVIDV